jgi:N-acetylneuraminic acid mutarotase
MRRPLPLLLAALACCARPAGAAAVAKAGSLNTVAPMSVKRADLGADKKGSWRTLVPMPTPRKGLGAGVLDGMIYAVGGEGSAAGTVERFDPTSNNWNATKPMSVSRNWVGAGVLNNFLYAVGGGGQAGKTAEKYHPGNDTWGYVGPMHVEREGPGVGVLGGLLYVVGGRSSTSALASAEVHHPGSHGGSWHIIASMSVARGSGVGVGVLDGLLYAVGGEDEGTLASAEVYRPSNNSWTLIAPMSTARVNLGVGVLGGLLFAVGGECSGCQRFTSAEVYRPATDTWTLIAPLTTSRDGPGVGVLGGLLYVLGGGEGSAGMSVEVYTPVYRCDTATGQCVASTDAGQTAADCNATCKAPTPRSIGSWAGIKPMPSARQNLGIGVLDGLVYVVGGYNHSVDSACLAVVEVYTPGSNTWGTSAPMHTKRCGLAVGVLGGLLYAVGGQAIKDGNDTASAEVYNPASNTWSGIASMSTPRLNAGIGVIDGLLYVVGGSCRGSCNGSGPPGSFFASAEVYHPGSNTWTLIAPMSVARGVLGIGVMGGRLYAVGGAGAGGSLASVEAYDPGRDTWRAIANMSTGRYGLGVGVLDGLLFAVGGYSSFELESAEAYQPANDSWSAVAHMSTKRYVLGAGVLNGLLYAVGGSPDGGEADLNSAEVYTPVYRCDTATGQCVASTGAGQTAADCNTKCVAPPTPSPPTPVAPPTPSPPSSSSGSSFAPAAAGAASAALLIGLLLFWRKKQQQQQYGVSKGSNLDMPILSGTSGPGGSADGGGGSTSDGSGGGGSGYVPPPTAVTQTARSSRSIDISLAQINQATSNFAPRLKLAEGAFGAVYRGKLQSSGTVVAIKVLTRKDDPDAAPSVYSGENSFALEAQVLGQYRHANIVGLVGQCIGDTQPEQFLVYEFMPGGSLLNCLKPGSTTLPLTWQERHIIASDVARGLEYLHVDADPPIIHQDIKSDNILLGEYQGQLVAKIADFGAVRIAPTLLTSTHYSATDVIGTKPYQPMEYCQMGHVSEKTDTFAFGVVLLELLTAKPPSSAGEFLFAELAPMLEEPSTVLPPLLDRRAGQWPMEKALALAAIAQKCLEMFVRKRCAVRDVLVKLDVLAGRQAIRRAARGEEYDPMTGELVKKA